MSAQDPTVAALWIAFTIAVAVATNAIYDLRIERRRYAQILQLLNWHHWHADRLRLGEEAANRIHGGEPKRPA